MNEVFLTPCRPHLTRQIVECVASNDHAVHRQLTELVHYLCNCGYSSGWVPVDSVPTSSEFIAQHAPSQDVLDLAQKGPERHA